MRRTRKWAYVAQEASRLAELGLSAREIARRLEVNKSTVTRWMAAGKLPKTHAAPVKSAELPAAAGKTPAEWSHTVRQSYALDATDEQLVTVAEAALQTSLDPLVAMPVRLTAMGRFQAIVKQLALVARTATAATPTPAAGPAKRASLRVVRRAAGDPRRGLMAVSE